MLLPRLVLGLSFSKVDESTRGSDRAFPYPCVFGRTGTEMEGEIETETLAAVTEVDPGLRV